jgi:disulfide bond formation protein DsbB
VLTFTPGDHPFLLFGHTAIWVHDPRQPLSEDVDLAYNFGTFDFGSPAVVPRFLAGRLTYWLSIATLDWTLSTYSAEHRGIRAQILRLDPENRDDLIRTLTINARPENRNYRYDFVRDNCSTRVRNAIDVATSGRLRLQSQSRPASSWRDQILRMASRDTLAFIGLDLLLSSEADTSITAWDEAFVPDRLQQEIALVSVVTSQGELPLVERDVDLLPGGTSPPRARPQWFQRYAATGVVGGAILLVLGYARRATRLAHFALGTLTAAMGLVAGLTGMLMLWFWVGTSVRLTHHNENLLLALPWSLGLIPVGLTIARGQPRFRTFARLIAISHVVAALLLALSKLGPWSTQQNHGVIAMMTPIWIALAIALRRVHFTGATGPAGGLASAEPAGLGGGGGALRSGGGGPP